LSLDTLRACYRFFKRLLLIPELLIKGGRGAQILDFVTRQMQASGGGLGGHGQEVCWAVVDGEVLGKEHDEVSMCASVCVCGGGGGGGVKASRCLVVCIVI
jgi:hypothetical protein